MAAAIPYFVLCHGQQDFEGRPRSWALRLCPDSSALRFDQSVCNTESDSQATIATRVRRLDLIEFLEDLVQFINRNANPTVLYPGHYLIPILQRADSDLTAIRGKANGVIQKIDE